MTIAVPLACACDKVQLEVSGNPITSTECCCNSCRAAGEKLQALPGAPHMLSSWGGTRCVLYRKDRVRFIEGEDLLAEYRLQPDSPTRRVVATCCNTPVFLEFQNGHWLSLYGHLWPEGTLPPLELRTMTSDLPDASVLPNDIPNGKRQSITFFAKLLGAWIAMGFRTPKVTVNGEINV